MIKAIIFDFDGTIVDTWPIAVKHVNALGTEYGYGSIDLEKLRGKNMRDVVKHDLKLNIFNTPGFLKKLKRNVQADIPSAKVFPNIPAALKEMHKHYRTGILTSNGESCTAFTKAKKLDIDFVSCNVSLFGKHIAIKKLLKEQKLQQDEIIYVGDEIRDIEACRKAGVRCIAVSWGFNTKKALKEADPDALVDTPAAILKAIKKLS